MISITEQIILTSLLLIVVTFVTLKKIELGELAQLIVFFVLKASILWFTIFGIYWIWTL
jgi:hypothetical protein